MKAAKFDYVQAHSLEQALQALAPVNATVVKTMGGSQSFGPMLNLRLTRPQQVVDVSQLHALRDVHQSAELWSIGAAVTHAEIEDGFYAPLRGTMLQYVAGGIAYRAVRNRGTIGGSLAHADPAADWILALTAMAATLELQSASGTRSVSMDEFMQGAYTTVLQEGEIIARIHVPRLDGQARWGYHKFCRKTGEFAEASCAAVFDPQRKRARIIIGALDGAPQPLPELARQVAQQCAMPDTAQIVQALSRIGDDPIRQSMQTAVVTRCLQQLLRTPEAGSTYEEQA